MKSPFKLLDAYSLADREVFFGREEEIEALYALVFKTPLLLVYGLSGTGKTSLVSCGLASRFDGPDWFPLFIRRNDDINLSLRTEITKALKKQVNGDLPQAVGSLFNRYLRPVYLIFDQFEELFILGKAEEQQRFITDLHHLLDANLSCMVMLVMREEYIGRLYFFEKTIPAIFDFRLRVEPMNKSKVKQVMLSSFHKFNISLEEPAEKRCEQMIDNISGESSLIHLPYLQVYLDMLYREDYKRTYSEQAQQDLPPIEFTQKEIDDFGKIENVLDKFLREKSAGLQTALKDEFPEIPDDAVQSVLNAFVTDDGTKRPLSIENRNGLLTPPPGSFSLPAAISPQALTACLKDLEKARLLRLSDNSAELAHDSLAALIDKNRSVEQRKRNELKKRIAAAWLEHEKTGAYPTRKLLDDFEEYSDRLELDEHLDQFIQDSYVEVERAEREKEEQERREKEMDLTKQKLAVERRGRRRAWVLSFVIGAVAIIAAGLGYNAYQASEKAEENLQKFHEADAQNVRSNVEDLLYRANALDSAGYHKQYQLLLRDARNVLEEKKSNPFLQTDIHRLDSLLQATSTQ